MALTEQPLLTVQNLKVHFYTLRGVVHALERVAFSLNRQETLGLAVMTETPIVLVNVQRGGPSTGLPTKVEQADLLSAIFGEHGDSPHVVLAPATIEECFHCMVTARRVAEALRGGFSPCGSMNSRSGFPRSSTSRPLRGLTN